MQQVLCILYIARAHELLLKIMVVLAKVGTLRERLPSVLVDACPYYCCTAHQALAALRSLCTEGCARTVRSTCVGVRNVIREFIWTTGTLLFTQVQTRFFYAYCTSIMTHLQKLMGSMHQYIFNTQPRRQHINKIIEINYLYVHCIQFYAWSEDHTQREWAY